MGTKVTVNSTGGSSISVSGQPSTQSIRTVAVDPGIASGIANTALSVASLAYNQSNIANINSTTAIQSVIPAFNQANTANITADLAFNKANNALANTSDISFNGNLYFPTGNVGIGTTTPAYKLEVAGSFAAQTKSFIINHQSKPDHKLRHGSLEGPENGVYVRGRSKVNVIELPEYWTWLVDNESITVTLTPIGSHQNLYVEKIEDNKIYINTSAKINKKIDFFYMINAERKDVTKMEVEIKE